MFSKHIAPFLLALILFLSACTAPKETTERFDGVELTVRTSFGPGDGSYAPYQALCAEFQEQRGAVVSDNSAESTEEWKQETLSLFANGQEPDVLFYFTGADAEPFVSNDQVVSFREIREVYPDYAANINLNVLQTMTAKDGRNYAVPVKGYWERLFVNTEIFNSLSLPLPKTFDDLLALAKPLTDAGYIPLAVSLDEVPHYLFEFFIFNHTGPSNHSHMPSNPDELSKAWLDGLNLFREAYILGLFPDEDDAKTHKDAFALFEQKKAAMIVDGSWLVGSISDTEHTAVIDFPSNGDGVRKNSDVIGGFSMGFYISRKAWDDPAKRAAAVAFVSSITTTDAIMRLNTSGAAVPVSLTNVKTNAEGQSPLLQSVDTVNRQISAFVGAVADKMNPDARNQLFSQILPIARGDADAQSVLRAFIEQNNASVS